MGRFKPNLESKNDANLEREKAFSFFMKNPVYLPDLLTEVLESINLYFNTNLEQIDHFEQALLILLSTQEHLPKSSKVRRQLAMNLIKLHKDRLPRINKWSEEPEFKDMEAIECKK